MSPEQMVQLWLTAECSVAAERIALDTRLRDLGVDSLDLMTFVPFLEEHSVFLPEDGAEMLAITVGDLVRMIGPVEGEE